MMKSIFVVILILAASAGGWYFYQWKHPAVQPPTYRTAVITRGQVIQEVSATGTIQPIKKVEVGTQVNGPITRLYVDFNSVVKEGDLVAQIDPAVYDATYTKARAQLKSDEATLEQMKVKLALSEKDLARKSELTKRKMLSQSDLDTALADRDSLIAGIKIAEASIEQSRATVKQSKTSLDYCTIRSPVDGIVIDRNVDEGQTVVSSMSAQKLFEIATDLKRIQVDASIPEADVGMIRTNQPVRFNVDAYHDAFTGEVKQIRLAATTVQNVVTYPVIVEADNPNEKLFPGMTANISVEVARRENALVIPSAALRFMPTNLQTSVHGPKIWILDSTNAPFAVAIKTDISDGTRIALASPDNLEGKEVILGFQGNGPAASGGAPKNPFMPTPPGATSRNTRRALR